MEPATCHIFGPVPSRRLGRSLGIDVVPAKTCSYDCVYCESGATSDLRIGREEFSSASEIFAELHEFLCLHPDGVDVLTFSSAGEPTLYLGLGELIEKIKRAYPRFPLIVLTNGSFLWDKEVRRCLMKADRVVPSLDAVNPDVFLRVNRPHPSLEIDRIVEGIREFRAEYKGRLHLEVALVSSINDSPDELSAIARTAELIRPDKVELNTVVRPPACAFTKGLTGPEMLNSASFFRRLNTEIVGTFETVPTDCFEEEIGRRIIATVGRRPCTVEDLAASLGVNKEMVELESEKLQSEGKLSTLFFEGRRFLSATTRS